MVESHYNQGTADCQSQDRTDQQPAPEAHEKQQDHDHDQDRLDQIDHEPVDGLGHRLGLHGDDADLHPHGPSGFELGEPLFDRPAHGHHVAALDGGDRHAHGRRLVEAELATGRLAIAAHDRGHVAQPDQPLGAGLGDDQVGHVVHGVESAGRIDGDVLGSQSHVAGGHGHVFLLKRAKDDPLRNPQLGHLLTRRLDIDDLRLHAVEGDPFDVLNQQQLALEQVGELLQLGVGVAVAGQGEVDAVDVAEIVVDQGGTGAGWKMPLGVTHLAAEFVPDLGQGVLVVLVLDVHGDGREASFRFGGHALELPELLGRLLDHVGDLFLDLLGGRAGIGGDHQGRLDAELGVLQPGEIHVGYDPPYRQQRRADQRDRLLAYGKLRNVHLG